VTHPLFDRRDLTRARDQAAAPAANGDMGELARELAETNRLLRGLLTQEQNEIQELCVTDREPPEQRMENFPLPGACRLIVRRPGAGGTFAVPINTPTSILAANENRLGGRITGDPANPVTLYLSSDLLQPGSGTPLNNAAAQIRLPAGGAWDLKLGDVLWCGNVIAVAAVASTVSVAEV
jgi:hypothetical protein